MQVFTPNIALYLDDLCPESVDGYVAFLEQLCEKRNELGVFQKNVYECAQSCQELENCVSFEMYQTTGCRLSDSCVEEYLVPDDRGHCVYIKDTGSNLL